MVTDNLNKKESSFTLKVTKLLKFLYWALLLVVVPPFFILPWADYWALRLIFGLMLVVLLPVDMLLTATNPKYLRAPPPPAKYEKFSYRIKIGGCVLLAIGGLLGLKLMTIPYLQGVSRLLVNGGKPEIVIGVVKDIDAPSLSGIIFCAIEIEGRSDNIWMLFHMGKRVGKRKGTKQEIYLLPGTNYALDIRPAPTNK
jgi:hypothetical protein